MLELEANGVEIVYTEIVNETMKSNLYQHQQQQQQQQQDDGEYRLRTFDCYTINTDNQGIIRLS